MATTYPKTPKFKSEGERKFFEYVKDVLPKEYIVYFGYRINSYETDIIMLVPNKGVVIIEIKGYSIKSIDRVIDNENILLTDNTYLRSPLKQADDYRYLLINEIKNKFNEKIVVMPMVCYPFISRADFENKRLDIISEEKETLLKEDFYNDKTFIEKIENLLNRRINNKKISKEGLMCVRKLFEGSIELNLSKDNKDNRENTAIKHNKHSNYYSILTYVNKNTSDSYIDELIKNWSLGSKILLVSDNENIIYKIKEKLNSKINELYLNEKEAFKLIDEEKNEYKDSIFNFNFYKIDYNENKKLEILDGKIDDNDRAFVEYLDNNTSFNLKQYKIEHAPIDTDIMVKAGAGTGKTYSMVSRINYLIYKHKFKSDSLEDGIVLITFTNEAARNMKKRLQESFENKYLLTKDLDILFMIESIENMKICTIHSLTKKILQRFSTKLGLGQDLSIVSGVYETNKEIDDLINTYLKNNNDVFSDDLINQISSYDIRKNIKNLLNRLSNKNLDIVNDNLNFGSLYYDNPLPVKIRESKEKLINMVLSVSKDVEKNIRHNCDNNNVIRLSDLVIKLKLLLSIYKEEVKEEAGNIKYLFVDEFQDTDDVQINLMKEFRKIFGFSFFVVGDVKQSIYRFRGAEEQAFEKLQENEKKFETYSLNKNYRSDKRLLEDFNKIFTLWSKKYETLNYITSDVSNDHDELKGINSYCENNEVLLEKVDLNNNIEEMLINNLRKYKEELGNKGSIAILVRENRQIEDIRRIINKKEYKDLYVETDTGGDLYKITPTLDLYKLTLALTYNTDPKYLFNLYTTSYVTNPMPKVDIYQNRNNKELLLKLFNEDNPIKNWDTYVKRLKLEPIMKVIRDIILDVKPWENYANIDINLKEIKKRKVYYKSNLEQVIEKIIKSNNNDYLTINKLQQYLNIMIVTKQNEDSREDFLHSDTEDEDTRIVCMTVHKSKGLEFDIVIMPYCNMNISDEKKTGLVDIIVDKNNIGYKMKFKKSYYSGKYKYEELQNNYYKSQSQREIQDKRKEETRILYVAMTRAIQKFIFFNDTKIKSNIDTWQKLIKGD